MRKSAYGFDLDSFTTSAFQRLTSEITAALIKTLDIRHKASSRSDYLMTLNYRPLKVFGSLALPSTAMVISFSKWAPLISLRYARLI